MEESQDVSQGNWSINNEKKMLVLKSDLHDTKEVLYDSFITDNIQIKERIGKGAFGIVHKVINTTNGENYALKIYTRNSKPYLECINNEVQIIKQLNENPSQYIVKCIVDPWVYDKYWIFMYELLDLNLYHDLKKNNFQGYEKKSVKKISTCIVNALLHLKKINIIHADLKPENIVFLNKNTFNVKVIDFGSSFLKGSRQHKKTNYIQSRYYRAPEIFLYKYYSFEIDMWSFGCIIFELFTGNPLLQGKNANDQYTKIIKFNNDAVYSDILLSEIGKNNEDSIDFMKKCLIWDMECRLTPENALIHDFLIKK